MNELHAAIPTPVRELDATASELQSMVDAHALLFPWGWVFFLIVPIVVLALVAGTVLVPTSKDTLVAAVVIGAAFVRLGLPPAHHLADPVDETHPVPQEA